MKYRDSRRSQLLKVLRRKAARFRFPGTKLGVIERQQAQHVDHCGALDQVQGQRGIRSFALSKKAEMPSLNQWRGNS